MTRRFHTPAGLGAVLASLLGLLSFVKPAEALPQLEGAPRDPVELGDIFVEAWLSFRNDLDTISQGHLNPKLLDAWFDEAPRFLLKDAARLGNAPEVVSAALRRLGPRHEAEDRALFDRIITDYGRTPIGHAMWGALIAAGDQSSKAAAVKQITDANPERRMEAARALAAGNNRSGFRYLRRALSDEPYLASLAALTLGRLGGREEQRSLERALERDPAFDAARAALGEIRMRSAFSAHHKMLVRRDPLGQRFENPESLYGVWFVAIFQALENGASNSRDLLSRIESQRKALPGDESGEVRRRQLKALIDFWERVDEALKASLGEPAWPSKYEHAVSSLRGTKPNNPTPTQLADRISAAISICAFAGKVLDHEGLFAEQIGYAALTPGGERVADFNLATSWRGTEGDSIVLDLDEDATVHALVIAQSCAPDTAGWIESVKVFGENGDEDWEITGETGDEGRYFRVIDTKGQKASRLRIIVHEIRGDRPGCIGEIRIK